MAQNVAGGGAFAIALQVHTPEKHGRFGLDHVRFDVAPSSLEAFEVRVIRKSLALRRHVPDIPIVSVPYKRLKT